MKKIFFLFLITIIVACNNTPEQTPATTTLSGVDEITKKIDRDPSNPALYAERAAAYKALEGYDESIVDYEKAITLDSMKPEYYHELTDVYLEYYRSNKAVETLRKAAVLFPERIETLLSLSELEFTLKQYRLSLGTAQKIFAVSPRNPDALYLVGMNYKELGDTTIALNTFQRGYQEDPDHLDITMQLALLYYVQNQDIAIEYFNNAIRIDSNDTQVLYSKAMYHQRRFQDDDALELYKKIIVKDMRYMEAYYNSAVLLHYKKDYEAALKILNTALEVQPDYARGYFFRGVVNKEMKQKEAAIKDFEQALKLDNTLTNAQIELDNLK